MLNRNDARALAAVRRETRIELIAVSSQTLVNDMFKGWLNETDTPGTFRMALNELNRREVWYELLNPDLHVPVEMTINWPAEEFIH